MIIEDLPDFGTQNICTKCNRNIVINFYGKNCRDIRWSERGCRIEGEHRIDGEHIHKVCANCGYVWYEKCADYKEVK